MLRQVIESGLSRHYISLRALCWDSLHQLADQMCDVGLISLDTQQSLQDHYNITVKLMTISLVKMQ